MDLSSISSFPYNEFTLLAKPAGPACNLACQYCFYLSKAQLYPESHWRMSDEVLEAYLKQLLAASHLPEASVAWQGGEPTLMGLDFFQHSIELVNKYKKQGQQVSFSLQTNGTLLDDEWCKFFKTHSFLIGLSLDGTAEMHNAYRTDKGGQGSFNRVRRAWDLLQAHGVDVNILCAVHAANASRPMEVYHFFRDVLRARFIQFIPIVEPQPIRISPPMSDLEARVGENPFAASRPSQRSVKPDQFGTFLMEIFDEWVQHDVGKVFIQSFESALASWCHLPASVCIFQEVCGSSLILEHNGDLYSCDHFVDPAHRLGNILEQPLAELARSSRQHQFGLDKRKLLPGFCLDCDWLFACQGECPRNRFCTTPDGESGLNYLCPSYKLFFQHVDKSMRRMADLLGQNRSPAEIMRVGL